MKYINDHDYHIHTCLSVCSNDKEQTPLAILKYAEANNLKKICVTDHYWDSAVKCSTAVNWWYEQQNYDHISESLPLPQGEKTEFLFGCETDMDSEYKLGTPKERFDDFQFIIVATTHFHHMTGKEWENATNYDLANLWVKRLDALLDMDLPFKKIGIAHLTCNLINIKSRDDYIKTLDLIEQTELVRIFSKIANLGAGIEINSDDMNFSTNEQDSILRIFRIAKDCGCKFYLGSDAHERVAFKDCKNNFEKAIDLLNLMEDDKFEIGR